jgi:Asp-tRNA(Asn)/Glu-tRNA(Gln) amidotransferase C subunit
MTTPRAITELRAVLERHRADVERFITECQHWLELVEKAQALNPQDVAAEYRKLRTQGQRHREALAALALKHERTTRRVEQLLAAARAMEKAGQTPPTQK